MDRSGKKEGLLEKTAEVFDLPGDVLAGLPRLELIGSREMRMENHRGILSYSPDAKIDQFIRESVLEQRDVDFGKLIAQGTPDEIQNNEKVIEAYLGVSDDADD